jgi:hypothetical protein
MAGCGDRDTRLLDLAGTGVNGPRAGPRILAMEEEHADDLVGMLEELKS